MYVPYGCNRYIIYLSIVVFITSIEYIFTHAFIDYCINLIFIHYDVLFS